jgi:mannose-1-phosphate guanylyltransferase
VLSGPESLDACPDQVYNPDYLQGTIEARGEGFMLHAVIMAGGGGTRFWPRSRQRRPKQFLTVTGERSLLQQAYERVEPLAAGRTWIITGAAYCEETARQLPDVGADHIVGEPMGRDTAACIGLGAALIARVDPEGVMIVTPADHVIEPVREFGRAAQVAAQSGMEHPTALITFGIPPTYPATGYGYIQRGAEVGQRQGISVFRVQRFREKPERPEAESFLASGQYYWNSGIFVWKATTLLDVLGKLRPQLLAGIRRIADTWDTSRRDEVLRREYPGLERISIDKGVMEHAPEVLVVPAPYRWDDVGSWLAVERMHPQDADGNTVLATHAGIETRNCVIVADPGRLVTTIGISNLLIIQDGDALLIADRKDEGTVKLLVDELKKRGLEKYL